jgi:hypothetical protein
MAVTYYIWKWADNDLPGNPSEIVAQLDREELPAAIRQFPQQELAVQLAEFLSQLKGCLTALEVYHDQGHKKLASHLRLILQEGKAPLDTKLLGAVWEHGLTVYNASTNRLVGLPKRNVVEYPGGRQFVDIETADIPGLLHELSAAPGLVALACYDRQGNMFQVWSYRRRYAVEWQVLPGRDFNQHRIWVAGRPVPARRRARLGTLNSGLNLFAPELLSLNEVHRLWKAFLNGETRPETHRWRDVTHELDSPGQPTRHRHTEVKEESAEYRFGSN